MKRGVEVYLGRYETARQASRYHGAAASAIWAGDVELNGLEGVVGNDFSLGDFIPGWGTYQAFKKAGAVCTQ